MVYLLVMSCRKGVKINVVGWNITYDDIWSYCNFETKEEAIQDALGSLGWIKKETSKNNPIIYIGECELIPFRTDVNVNRIMEELNRSYCVDSGYKCNMYIYENVSEEQKKWLEDRLSDLMKDFNNMLGLKSIWFQVTNKEKINLNKYK